MNPGFPPYIPFLFLASSAATCLIWRQIFRSERAWYVKLLHAAFAAVPFLGPMLYIFLAPPPQHPLDEQMPRFPKGTSVYPTFSPLIKSLGRAFRGGRRRRR